MQAIIDYVRRHDEPVSRSEFRMAATVGIALALAMVFLLAYGRSADDGDRGRLPASWQRPERGALRPVRC